MKTLAALVATAACFIAAPAMAQIYGSVGYSSMAVHDYDVTFGNITGRAGMQINHVGAEIELSHGIKSDNYNGVAVKLQDEGAIYAVGFWPVNENLQVLGRVGYAGGAVTNEGGEYSVPGNGLAYGVGAEYFFTPHNGLRGDYTRDEAAGANVWTISYAFRL